MAKLLYVKTSPRKERSHSSKIAEKFIESYRTVNQHDIVEELDLWHMDLPPFDGDVIDAKYAVMHQTTQTEGQLKAWNQVTALFKQFASADKYLFSVPMWNFGIPYRMKHYIDLITQPGMAFNVSPEGKYTGLVTGKPAVLVCSSGGSYRPGSGAEAFDMQKTYLKLWLHFIGFTDIKEIVMDGTLGDPANSKGIKEACLTEADEMAQTF